MATSLRYSTKDLLGLLTLVPFSAGLVYLTDVAAGAALDSVRPLFYATMDGIASLTGGFSVSQRGFLIYASAGSLSGLLLACVVLLMLMLRSYWATLVAFSLPVSTLVYVLLLSWVSGVPLTLDTASVLIQPAIVAVVVASGLITLCVFGRRRIHEGRTQTKKASPKQSPWQRSLLIVAFAAYLLSCVYGWYGMASAHVRWIEAREYWENIE